MESQDKNMTEPRKGWEEMIKQEVEKNGPPERLIPDFLMKIIVIGPGKPRFCMPI